MPPRATARETPAARKCKIVITGPVGAGKTSLIRTMSEIEVVSTERAVSDRAHERKTHTTVAMDFGRMTIAADLLLYLFGTPGQQRFDFMWEILAEGMLGFIVLVDAQRDDSFAEALRILDFFRTSAAVPYVVAVNKGDAEADGGVARTRARLGLEESVRCVPVHALDRESVKGVLLELLYAVMADVERSPGSRAQLQPAGAD